MTDNKHMNLKKLAVAIGALLLLVPATAQGFTIKGYGVRDAGDRIVHRITICSPPSDRLHRFEITARSELFRGGDRRIRYASVTARGCDRWTLSYPDALRYEATYFGRVKVRLERTDWILQTRWRAFDVR